ncbi:putative transmembrane region and signal peptide protein [Rhodopirellula islandica]|uniref:Transmembrane region and signal peptide protein n=1 Tax=Rhodopirellula islandica TaxID=595434 RepID=A0A0J1BHJ9_RHOIS|nr:TIGR03067 domain-containing protein [Rhodopirellula islandica]KLU06015.1 putative transmembrane region and signal peptide protein [Rhodopirellula islandica]
MSRYSMFAVLPCLVFASIVPAQGDEHTQPLLKRLAGVWDVEEGVNQGEEIPEDELEGTIMKIEKNMIITYDREKREVYRALFTVDETKKPVQIDMTTEMKGMPPMKSLGIIQMEEGDEFELCYALPGADRPKEFQSPKGSKVMLFEAERED